jgi:hypothetical protein
MSHAPAATSRSGPDTRAPTQRKFPGRPLYVGRNAVIATATSTAEVATGAVPRPACRWI